MTATPPLDEQDLPDDSDERVIGDSLEVLTLLITIIAFVTGILSAVVIFPRVSHLTSALHSRVAADGTVAPGTGGNVTPATDDKDKMPPVLVPIVLAFVASVCNLLVFWLFIYGIVFIALYFLFSWIERRCKHRRKKKRKHWWQKLVDWIVSLVCFLAPFLKWITLIAGVLCLVGSLAVFLYCLSTIIGIGSAAAAG